MTHVEGEEPRETSGLTVRLVVSYVRKLAGPEGVDAMLRRAGQTRPPELLEDEREWYSYEAKIALFRAAAEVTGQPDVGLRVGSHVFESTVGPSVRLMLSMFGSPAALLRHIAHANGKFSQCADLTAEIHSPTSATATYRLHDGYTPSRFDCDYTRGMLAQIPPMFGLPPATIEHDECQVDGAPGCRYEMHWSRRQRRWLRPARRDRAVDAHVVHQRLQELQHAVTDLVGRDDLEIDTLLGHVVERAAYAVNARAFVLAARLEPGDPAAVHAQGLPPERAQELAAALLGGGGLRTEDHVLAVPVQSTAHDYGTLAALGGAPFIPAEQDLLQAYAALAAASLDALVARRETEDRRRTAEILLDLAGDVGVARRAADVVAAATRSLRTLALADVACVLLVAPDGRLRLADATGFGPADLARLADVELDPAGLPELARLLSTPHATALVDDRQDGPWLGGLLGTVGVRQGGLVGLRCRDHLHGVGLVGWRTPVTSAAAAGRAVLRLTGAGIQTTTGLDKTELLQQVQLQARTDALTGLVNRRHFVELLEAEQGRVDADGRPAGLLFIDLDGFKQVNDGLGHAAGDALLVDVAGRLAACLAPGDTLARLGGDEFTVLSPAATTDGDLLALAGRLLRATETPYEVEGQPVVVRPSIGATLVRAGGEADGALRAADGAMYHAKTAGGGRVVLAEHVPAA